MSMIDAWFGRRPAALVGLDISDSSVKLVELAQGAGPVLRLEHFAREPLEIGWVADGQIEKFDEVVEAVRRVLTKSGTRCRRAALAMPSATVITQKVVLPAGLREDELELQVETEAAQILPFPLDEVSLDFCVLGPHPGLPGEVEVLIAASRKDRVQDRQGLLEAAGLRPVVVDVASHAARLALRRLVATWPETSREALLALVEIGAETTVLTVLRGEEVVYERAQAFGGALLSQQIAREAGWPLEEAERRKIARELPEALEAALVPPFVTELAQEIERALQFFFNSTPHLQVDRVLLSGGTAGLPGLDAAVRAATGFPAQVLDPFEGMALGPGVREARLRREAPAYLTACGLAMRSFLA